MLVYGCMGVWVCGCVGVRVCNGMWASKVCLQEVLGRNPLHQVCVCVGA